MSETRTAEPASMMIVSTGKKKQVNRLVDRQQYAKLGRNDVVEARPSVLHFGGYSLHQRHSQTVRIVNISKNSQRLHIINPTTPHFKARYKKKGLIAPGMAEEITIDFQPNEWRYYYDCLRLHTETENLLIPIHAYPVMNDVIFPRRIDFGDCPLAQPTQKRFKLECKVPIQFEFEITTLKPHSDITVTPESGVIPANGHTEIVVTFRPSSVAATNAEIQVNISQFNFVPFSCVISGSSKPGLVREIELEKRSEELVREEQEMQRELTLPSGVKMKPQATDLNSYSPAAPGAVRGPGSGGAIDFGRLYLDKKQLTKSKPGQKMELKLPQKRPPTPDTEIEGLQIPAKLNGTVALNFILTQQSGKLKPKDLRAAIDKQVALRQKQKDEQQALRDLQGGISAQPGSLSMQTILVAETGAAESTTRQLKEMVFLQDLQEIEKAEKDREFQSQNDCLGEPPFTGEQIEFLRAAREQHNHLKKREERDKARVQYTTQAFGPYNVAAPVRVVVRAGFVPNHTPSFGVYQNDVWRMRKKVMQRFRLAVTKVIVRHRAARRLERLRKRLAGCMSRADVEKLVATDSRTAQMQGSSGASSGIAKVETCITAKLLHPLSFPEYLEQSSGKMRELLPVETPKTFNDVGFMKLKAPHETVLVGHQEYPELKIGCYVPIERSRALRVGAHQEEGVRAAREITLDEASRSPTECDADAVQAEDGAAATNDPDGAVALSDEERKIPLPDCDQRLASPSLTDPIPTNPMSLLVNGAGIRVFSELRARTEAEPDYILRPNTKTRFPVRTVGLSLQKTVGSASVVSLGKRKTITQGADGWRPRHEGRISTVSGHGQQLALWDVPDMPKLLKAQCSDDVMSDSESEDEGEQCSVPTVDLARSIFLDLAKASLQKLEANEASQDETGAKSPRKSTDEEQETAAEPPLPQPIMEEPKFRRLEQMLSLEDENLQLAEASAAKLPGRINKIKDLVENVKHAFAVKGHGVLLPAHKVFS